MQAGGTPLLAPSTSEGVAVHVSRLTMEPPAPTGEAGLCAASKDQSAGEAVDPITTAPSISIPIPTRESPPVALELQRADSPPHVSIASLPKHCEAPCNAARGGRLLPGRRRILRAAAKQLAAVELLREQLDVSAVDIDTHCMPPPTAGHSSSPPQQQQQGQTSEPLPPSSQGRHLELLRLHALLQAAVGAEQDLVVVGLHQVATQHRHAWAACVAAAFAAAEGTAARALERHLYGGECSCVSGGGGAETAVAAAASRRSSVTHYEQIVPLDASPHHNQLLLVYVHPSHLPNITLLSIAKSRLGSFCCRTLQHNYSQPWGLSAATQRRLQQLREQRKQQQKEQQQQQQQRMDFFFNFTHFLGLSDVAVGTQAAPAPPVAAAAASAAAAATGDPDAEETRRPHLYPIHLRGLSRRQWRLQERLERQRQQDGICCSRRCSALPGGSSSMPPNNSSNTNSRSGCGCELFQEGFAYGGVAARVLIGATPVVFACADVKLNEEALEICNSGSCCTRCPQQAHNEAGAYKERTAAGGSTGMSSKVGKAAAQEHRREVAWRKILTRAVQRQQLLAILADLRFETDSGWASALDLKPLMLLGAQHQLGALEGVPSCCCLGRGGPKGDTCVAAAGADRQRRLQELQQLDISTKESPGFFCCRVPQRATGPQLLSFQEAGKMAQWRRPAWTTEFFKGDCVGACEETPAWLLGGAPSGVPGEMPGGSSEVCGGVIARFWVRWMSCRLVVERVDTERVKTSCNELRQTLKQEGRCLSKLVIDPPLLQLPPVRPFEPMELKISLSNPHATLPTAYSVYCLSDSGKSIVPLSHVSYWHGALSRKWLGGPLWEAQSLRSMSSSESALRPPKDLQLPPQRRQQQLLQWEAERLQEQTEEKRRASGTQVDTPRDTSGAELAATAAAAESTDEVRQPMRLERWLLVDWPQGFLKGGETRVLSMLLNIQEGIYRAQELACGVLVLRLEDSRQDFFFCLAASLIPSLLGAELQPLALLGDRPLLPETPPKAAAAAQTPAQPAAAAEEPSAAAAVAPLAQTNQTGAKGVTDAKQRVQGSDKACGGAEVNSSLLPLPKELWWLLSHLHSKSQAAATSLGPQVRHTNRYRRKRREEGGGDEGQFAVGQHQGFATGSSTSNSSSNSDSSSSSSDTSDSNSECHDDHFSGGLPCSSNFREKQQRGLLGSLSGESLTRDVVKFLSVAGGDSFTWPSFLAGSDTYMQRQTLCSNPPTAAAVDSDDRLPCCRYSSNNRRNSRRRRMRTPTGEREESERSTLSETFKHCPSCCRGPLEREVAFLRACLERGVEVPSGISVGAALALLEYWGRTCCFFPSEFAVQDVQTDSLHIICRAVLLSLPPVHRNAFISVISALNGLLQAAMSSKGPNSFAGSTGPKPGGPYPGGSCGTGGAPSGDNRRCVVAATAAAGAESWDCTSARKARGYEASEEEATRGAGEKGTSPPSEPNRGPHKGPLRRILCLESVGAAELLRHAVLLWAGVWLLKSCRPAVRQAVLGHFITRV